MDSSGGAADDLRARTALAVELNENAQREMGLAVALAELERNRWAAFTIVELEWISSAAGRQGDERGHAVSLPAQANAELERRARISSDADD